MTLRTILLSLSVLTLSACASSYDPVVDPKHTNMANYDRDLTECHALADKVDVLKETFIGVGGGGLLGGAGGAALGAMSGNAGQGAAAGALLGAGAIGGTGYQAVYLRQLTIINNCLKGRGYKLLG